MTYRPSSYERAKIREYLKLTDVISRSDVEEAIAEALFDLWYDVSWTTVTEVAGGLVDEYWEA